MNIISQRSNNLQDSLQRIALYALPFLFSLCFHEYAHAWTANKLGDPTAKHSGRLTLNPWAHIDIVWTIIIPAITLLVGGIYFGSAKPVPVDPRNFKNSEKGMALVAFAGPLSNIILGVIFAFIFVAVKLFLPQEHAVFGPLSLMLEAGVLINFFLAFFNLIPFPPLDGSRIVRLLLPYKKVVFYEMLAPYSFILIIVLWYIGVLQYIVGAPAYFFYRESLLVSYHMLAGLL